MNAIAQIASIVLGAAFLVAGGSKLAAGESWPVQARGLGAPAVTISVLPWIEMIIGAALVFQLVPPIPALAALSLLVAFTVLIVVRLSKGERPPCACFGAWSEKPIGRSHLLRNGALMMLGVVSLLA